MSTTDALLISAWPDSVEDPLGGDAATAHWTTGDGTNSDDRTGDVDLDTPTTKLLGLDHDGDLVQDPRELDGWPISVGGTTLAEGVVEDAMVPCTAP